MQHVGGSAHRARHAGASSSMRRQRLAAGDRLIGWKVGFGAPALLER